MTGKFQIILAEKTQIAQFLKDEVWDETFYIGVHGHKGFYKEFLALKQLDEEILDTNTLNQDNIETIITFWQEESDIEQMDCLMLLKTHQDYYIYLHAKFDGFGHVEYLNNCASKNLKKLISLGIEKNYQQKLNWGDINAFLEKEQLEENIKTDIKSHIKLKI